MQARISKGVVAGIVRAPSSKSYTIRALLCAALASGTSEIRYPLASDDTEAASSVLTGIGVNIKPESDMWKVTGGGLHSPKSDLYCGYSAATHRFTLAVCSIIHGRSRITAGRALMQRPIRVLIEALKSLGAEIIIEPDGTLAVSGGRLKNDTVDIRGDESSQYISALMLIAPMMDNGLTIRLTTPLESGPYILMTIECLKKFGINVRHTPDMRLFNIRKTAYVPAHYTVEGDWSSASYFLALGAAAGEVTVQNLNAQSLQGDKAMLRYLTEMGAEIRTDGNSVTVKRMKLNALKADLNECIDLLPTMAGLAAVARGTSEFTGIRRARLKESNRVTAVREGLERLGIAVQESEDSLMIRGGVPGSATIDSKHDHRIAMAFSIPAVISGNVVIDYAECVAKTYPEYWQDLINIGGKVQL